MNYYYYKIYILIFNNQSSKQTKMQSYNLTRDVTKAIIPTIEALKKLTENDKVPFNPDRILKVLVSFEEHFEGKPDPPMVPNFYSIHWKIVERQQKNGFVITPEIRSEINKHRLTIKSLTNMEEMMEEMFVNAY